MRARAAAVLLGALAAAGCATTKSADVLGIGDVDEEGCTLVARQARAVQPQRVGDPVDASASSGREKAMEESRWRNGGVAPQADKVVGGDLYVDYYTCPKITVPEKPRD